MPVRGRGDSWEWKLGSRDGFSVKQLRKMIDGGGVGDKVSGGRDGLVSASASEGQYFYLEGEIGSTTYERSA